MPPVWRLIGRGPKVDGGIAKAERGFFRHLAGQASPNLSPAELLGVSCSSPSQCVAVGEGLSLPGRSPRGPLVISWDGTRGNNSPHRLSRWLRARSTRTGSWEWVACRPRIASPWGRTTLQSVSHWGVHWDGTNWQLALPEPARWPVELTGLSCVAHGYCMAVGGAYPPTCTGCSVPSALAELWDGKHWSALAKPGRDITGALSGVSCTSEQYCVAVGNGPAERWDGTRWQFEAAASGMEGVSCLSPAGVLRGRRGELAGQQGGAGRKLGRATLGDRRRSGCGSIAVRL